MRFLAAAFLIGLLLLGRPASATVSTTTSSVTALGNGVTTVWNYSFPMLSAGDAVITVTNTTVTPNIITTLTSTQYTLTGVGTNGGTVTYPLSGSPLASGYTITISRVVPLVQTTSLCNQGPPFCAVEHALDYLTYIAQQLQAQITSIVAGIVVPAVSVSTVTRITSGVSATATSTYTDQQIIWVSATTAAKTTTLYACTSAVTGYKVAVADEQGTASSYPISVTPASGTIGGLSTNAIYMNLASVIYVCDGNANWVPQ